MNLVGLRLENESFARLRLKRWIHPRNPAGACDIEMYQSIRAKRLDELDLDGDARRERTNNLEVLGTNADDALACRSLEARAKRCIERCGRCITRKYRALVTQFDREKFIVGEPMKPATNWFAGRS